MTIEPSNRSTTDRAVISAPFGALLLEACGSSLLSIEFGTKRSDLAEPVSSFLQKTARQFESYFEDPRWRFSIDLPLLGTPFQRRVWSALCSIEPGTAKSYGLVAAELETGPRAVAAACRANRFPILIPCHRVVASTGLGGYCGAASGPLPDIKRWLLRHEGYESA